jgi:hypothetical protein
VIEGLRIHLARIAVGPLSASSRPRHAAVAPCSSSSGP